MKKIITFAIFSILFISCNQTKNEKQNTNNLEVQQMENQTLIGKKAVLTYSELKAEVHYISQNQIHWKTTDPAGNTAEQTNELTYKPIAEHLFFLNWVEDDGTTVSQVIDLEKNTVSAYLSFEDENGKRIAQLLEGKFELLK